MSYIDDEFLLLSRSGRTAPGLTRRIGERPVAQTRAVPDRAGAASRRPPPGRAAIWLAIRRPLRAPR